ncbi:MAG: ATP phosphoribosyltransferase, partial [Porticoccus sp.]|nr:ATP phosphoribosyltransferase [Porticoccus sp.]
MEITIALTKGRILKETLGVLAQAGITPVEDMELSR